MTRVARFRIPPTTLARELDGETVLVNLASGFYYGLDEVGSFVWARLSAGAGAGEIVDAMLTRYDVTPERASEDTARLLEELRAHGLVETHPG